MAGFPVRTINGRELEERCVREGDVYINGGGGTTISAWSAETGSGGAQASNFARPTFKAVYLKTLSMGCSLECWGQLLFGQMTFIDGSAVGTSPIYVGNYNVGQQGISIPFNTLVKMERQFPTFRIQGVKSQAPELMMSIATTAGGVEMPVTKTRNAGTAGSGTFTYIITVTNNTGSSTSGTITLTDFLPENVRFLSATGTGWTIPAPVNGVITATTSDVIANNGTKTITVSIAVKQKYAFSMSGVGYIVDNDVNYDAPAIWWDGTSISAGTGVTTFKQMYAHLIKNYIRDTRGIPNRIVNKAIGGTTSTNQEELRKFDNRYDAIEIPLAAFFEHGANDSAQSIPPATTIANLIQYINHWRRMEGGDKVQVIVLAPFPTSDTANEARHATLNTALISAINDIRLTDLNVHYIVGTRTLFNPVTQSGSFTTDGLHLNPAGNVLVVNQVIAYIEANNLFQS